ncbi:MAG: sulfatase-like hydrolase/transferase [Verrucomicrobiota bacterium JB025]|nr:sulfatase-like hydrolase/transferase [Verrucomicrobiota bacterium JB025]
MKFSCSRAFAALALSALSAAADTTLISGATFDLTVGNWTNGMPGAGNPGVISADYSNGGNVNMSSVGTASVTQVSGNGTGGQWNYHSNPDYSFHLDGGTLTNTSGTFFVNDNSFTIGGGALSATDLRLQGAGGALAVTSGSLSTDSFLVLGGSLTMSGGSITNTANNIIFNRNSSSTGATIGLSGGTLVAAGAHSLLNNSDLSATIGGSFSADAPQVTNLFNGGNHAGSSSLNFSSDWTGSLTLDSATAWADVFEAGDVSVNGVELGAGDFESYFENQSGVIRLIAGVSTSVTISSVAPTTGIIAANNTGTTFSKIFDEDASANHARGQLFHLPNVASGGYQITGITVHKNGNQTFSSDTLTVRIFAGTRADWDSGSGHDSATDGNDYYVDTNITELHAEAFTVNGLIDDNSYVTLEFSTPVVVADDSDLGFLLTYDASASSSPDFFQYNEGETSGRIQVTTTEHSTADTRHMRHFVLGDAFEGGFPETDSDVDGLSDAWEVVRFGNLDQTGIGNPDGDGLDNGAEEDHGTNPNLADTDSDGLRDEVEVAGVTDPVDPDSDDDGLLDGVESNTGAFVSHGDTGTNPIVADTDDDGAPDGLEITLGTDPFDDGHQPAERPNIVFIMIDDLDTREIGVYGQATLQTPRVDTMASQGMMFSDFYTASPVCHSSRSCLMTGQDSRRAQDTTNSTLPLAAERVTIAEVLKQAGYTTGCVGKWGLGDANTVGAPWNQGFDFFCGYLDQVNAHRFFPKFLWKNDGKIYFDQTLATSEGGSLYLPGAQNYNAVTDDWGDAFGNVCSHDVVVAEGLQFIEDNADCPFFLYCAWTPPHAYMYPAATLDALTDADGLLYDPLDLDQTMINEVYPGAPFGGTAAQPDFNDHCYASMVSAADRDVGRIMDKLVELGIDDNTLVIFCSDNGEDEPTFLTSAHLKPGYQDLRGLKRDCYEGGIRSPFVAWWPGTIEVGSASDVIGTFSDMLPTFAEMAGLSTPASITGRSILPALLGGSESDLQARDYHYWYFNLGNLRLRAVRQGDWKIVRDRATDGSAPTYELFNLASDPYETSDLSGTETAMLGRLIPLVEGTHEVRTSTYFRADDEFFTWSNLTPSAYQIGTPDGSGASNGYSLTSGGTGYGFNYLPFESGLSELVTFTATLQFPSGGAGSLLLGATNDRAQAFAVRIDSDKRLLEVRHQSSVIASGSFVASDFPGSRAEITLVLDPGSGAGEVRLGSLSLPFAVGSSVAPLQFWGFEVESTTMETSRPRWQLGGGLTGSIRLRRESGMLVVEYQQPLLSAGDVVIPQFSYDLRDWHDDPPGLIDLRSAGSQGEVTGVWVLSEDSLLPRNHASLFFRHRTGSE